MKDRNRRLNVNRMQQEINDDDEVAFLSRHFVALACLYETTNANGAKSQNSMVISGFLLELDGYFFWVTAGHCLKKLETLISTNGVKVLRGSFIDSFAIGAKHKEPLPFRYEVGRGFYLYQPEDGIDFALVPLVGLQIRAFAVNNLVPITRDNWVHQADLSFDFYRMLGIPAHRVTTTLGDDGMMNISMSQSLLGVERIGLDDLGETPWDSEAPPTDASFIGRLSPGCTIRDLEGMSGGPIFGFRRDEKGRLSYHVVALQSRWWNQQRAVFGCSVPMFAELVYQQVRRATAKGKKASSRRATARH